MSGWLDRRAVQAYLEAFEQRLNPAHPEEAGARVLAYGEISAALTLPGSPALSGLVVKRMSGFADSAMAGAYQSLLVEYLKRLAEIDIRTVPTAALTVELARRRPSVYLVQPLMPAESLGNQILHNAEDAVLVAAVSGVLAQTLKAFTLNAAHPGDELSIDAQLSNWSFEPQGSTAPDLSPRLIDVGTPFIRRNGRHAFDEEILLSAVPPGIRNYYRRKGTASEYMDDYFEPRLIAMDLLGNFHKEGAADRIPVALAVANEWLAGPAAAVQRQLGTATRVDLSITTNQVAEYYRQDAATLELFLRVRRIDRGVRKALGRRYDFILPGRVQR